MLVSLPVRSGPAFPHFLQGGGEMGARMRAHNWQTSPLGAPEGWPQTLQAFTRMMLEAKQAMFVAWGPDLAFLYNDAYAPIFGAKHPNALGRPFAEVWFDIWPQISPIVNRTLAGHGSWHEDLLIAMERNGYREDAYFSFSYTPLYDEAGQVAGIFCAATETTGKVLAERQQVVQRERLHQMFEQAPGMLVLLHGPDHVFELANAAYYQLVGQRDVIGKSVREALPELEGQGFFELLDEAYHTGEPYVGRGVSVSVRRTVDGPLEQRFIDFIYQPIRGADGQITGIFVEGFDVTEAKQAEEALRASEEFNRRILESSTDCIKVLDTGARLQFMSQGGMQVMEVDDFGTVQGCDWRSFWSGLERDKAKKAIETALAGGTGRFQGSAPTMKDTLRWWDVAVTPIFGADGQVEKILSVSRDITATKKAEEALRESDALHRAIIQATPECVKLVSADGRLLDMNPAGLAMIEASDGSSVRGANIVDVIAPEYRSEWRRNHARICKGESLSWEFDIIGLQGTRRRMETHAVPLAMPDGTVAQLAVTRDVSARRKWEEHQRVLINELNHRVKNTLATVQSIASHSLRGAKTLEDARASTEARLIALSRAHDVLTRENWDGANLREIVAQAAEPYDSSEERRVTVSGPEVRLSPRKALAIAMALQELATNAVKYGALSNTSGRVHIEWETRSYRDGLQLRLIWREKGGPPVQAPERRGFGTRLIERTLAQDLNGEVKIEFASTGLVCTVHSSLQYS